MGELSGLAVARLEEQLEDVKKCNNQMMFVIAPSTVKTLKAFADNDDFAAALLNEEKCLKECLEFIFKDVLFEMSELSRNQKTDYCFKNAAMSDLYCYQKAAEYYFENAAVSFKMVLTFDDTTSEVQHDGTQELPINIPKPEPAKKPDKKTDKKASCKSDAAQEIGSETPLQVLKPATTKGKAAKEEPNRKCIQLDLFASLTGGC
jgi:hypothetical protein